MRALIKRLSQRTTPLLERERVVWQLLIPQLFVILITTIAGIIFKEQLGSSYVYLNLTILLYLSIGCIAIHQFQKAVRSDLILNHILLLQVVFAVYGLFSNIDPMTGYFLPVTALWAVSIGLKPSGAIGVKLAVISSGIAAVFLGVKWFLYPSPASFHIEGPVSLIVVIGVVSGRWLITEAYRSDEESQLTNAVARENGDSSKVVVSKEWRIIFDETLREETLTALSFRLSVAILVSGALVLSAAVAAKSQDIIFGIFWILIAAYELWLLSAFRRQTTLGRLFGVAFLSCCGTLAWWALLPTREISSEFEASLVMGVILAMIVSLPWSEAWRALLTLLAYALAIIWSVTLSVHGELFSIWSFAITVIAIRTSASQAMETVTKASMVALQVYLNKHPDPFEGVRAFVRHALVVTESNNAIVLYDKSPHEYIENNHSNQLPEVRQLHASALRDELVKHTSQEGMVALKSKIGEQLSLACEEWFGKVPAWVIFVRLPGLVVNNAEEEALVVFPVLWRIRFLGLLRAFRHICVLAGLVRAWLAGYRSKMLSSDAVQISQKSLALKDQEFNEAIHIVNNVAQDIAVQCDLIRRRMKESTGDNSIFTEADIKLLEDSSRNLSSGVSDLKRIRELLKIKWTERQEIVKVSEIIEELQSYCRYRSQRRDLPFTVENKVKLDSAISVVSREYLDAVIRLMIKLVELCSPDTHRVAICIVQNSTTISFGVESWGQQWPAFEMSQNTRDSIDTLDTRELDYLRCIRKLCELSSGSLEITRQDSQRKNSIVLSLKLGEIKTSTPSTESKWVLLVDDNPQVTSFYGKVAEALNLPFHTADSLQKANNIIIKYGRPKLIVTDIRLGEESGLDLVKGVREQFGKDLPIIVVSGETGVTFAEEAERVGASRFLSKPLGRGKLVSEIKAMLG